MIKGFSLKDINPDRRYKKITNMLAQYVIARDNGLCQICGQSGSELHHVMYRSDKVIHKANNLIVLCKKHHVEEHNFHKHDKTDYLNKIRSNELRFRKRLI